MARQSDIIKKAGKDPTSIPYKWFSCDDFKAILIITYTKPSNKKLIDNNHDMIY